MSESESNFPQRGVIEATMVGVYRCDCWLGWMSPSRLLKELKAKVVDWRTDRLWKRNKNFPQSWNVKLPRRHFQASFKPNTTDLWQRKTESDKLLADTWPHTRVRLPPKPVLMPKKPPPWKLAVSRIQKNISLELYSTIVNGETPHTRVTTETFLTLFNCVTSFFGGDFSWNQQEENNHIWKLCWNSQWLEWICSQTN